MTAEESLQVALALSLAEEEEQQAQEKEKERREKARMEERDAALALELQQKESGRVGGGGGGGGGLLPPPPGPSSNRPSSSASSSRWRNPFTGTGGGGGGGVGGVDTGAPVCYVCNGVIGRGTRIILGDNVFHDGCFRCDGCGQQVGSNVPVKMHENHVYHTGCYAELFGPRCCLCAELLPRDECNRIVWMHHAFFEEEKYCGFHDSSGGRAGDLPTCFTCHRHEPLPSSGKDAFQTLSDGRKLCMACCRTVVVDSEEARPIFERILTFYENVLELPVSDELRRVPVLLVDLPTLNERTSREEGTHGDHGGGTLVRGLCLSECGHIQHIAPGTASYNAATGHWELREPQVVNLRETRSVTAVLTLYGMSYDMTAQVLAHEAFHAWLRLNTAFSTRLPSQVEEGLCQLIAHLWLEHTHKNCSSEDRNAPATDHAGPSNFRLRQYWMHILATDSSPVYGDGFRMAAAAYAALGLPTLLEHVRTTQSFPTV